MDALGHVVRRWVATALGDPLPGGAIGVDIDGMHHEVFELPNGNLLTLSPELRDIGPGTCVGYADTLHVVGDEVVELDPETGDVVQEASLFDAIARCRGSDHDFGAGFWNQRFGGVTTQDWTHSNAVVYDAARGVVIVSSRNQSSIFKLNRDTRELEWVLGQHGDLKKDDPFAGDFDIAPADRFYQQHDVQVLPNGHILMFDNGVAAVHPYSRALEFASTFNPDRASEAHTVWEYRHDPDIAADVWGSVQRFDNGNTLVCFGQRTAGDRTTIVEVNADAELLWRIQFPERWGVYRAQKVADPPRGFVVPAE